MKIMSSLSDREMIREVEHMVTKDGFIDAFTTFQVIQRFTEALDEIDRTSAVISELVDTIVNSKQFEIEA